MTVWVQNRIRRKRCTFSHGAIQSTWTPKRAFCSSERWFSNLKSSRVNVKAAAKPNTAVSERGSPSRRKQDYFAFLKSSKLSLQLLANLWDCKLDGIVISTLHTQPFPCQLHPNTACNVLKADSPPRKTFTLQQYNRLRGRASTHAFW